MPLPSVYIDADLRAVTPVDTGRGRLGVAFDTAIGVVRIAIDTAAAAALAREIAAYVSTSRPGFQSPRSDDSPSSAGLPQDGQNVAPADTSSQACCAPAYEPRSSSPHTTCQRDVDGLNTIKKGPAGDACRKEVGCIGRIVSEPATEPAVLAERAA